MSADILKKVAVGMSGGVDSSVSALILKNQGFSVFGIFMKNWEEDSDTGLCQSAADYEDALMVCQKLNIPLYSCNFSKEYWDLVFAKFLDGLKLGYTPNPDVLCNKEIKFRFLLKKAKELGADFLATGHYCQTEGNRLLRGLDQSKDQSYFLHAIDSKALKDVIFPVGNLLKKGVRALAEEADLITAKKKDSTGICFIGERNFRNFLKTFIPEKEGDFRTLSGKVVGKHTGAAYYTIGQRKGLGIGGAGDAWFVVEKDIEKNIVFVEQGENHPALFSSELIAYDVNWIAFSPAFPLHCTAKIRYRQEDQDCIVTQKENGQLRVSFPIPQRAITSGQSIVFYHQEQCLGGATILHTKLPAQK